MNQNTETMSPTELLGTLDDAGGSIANAQREGITTTVSYDQIVKARTAVAALIEREAALAERVKALETALKSFPEEPNPYMYRMAQARARAALAACKPSS